jgi:hypothetical protein
MTPFTYSVRRADISSGWQVWFSGDAHWYRNTDEPGMTAVCLQWMRELPPWLWERQFNGPADEAALCCRRRRSLLRARDDLIGRGLIDG